MLLSQIEAFLTVAERSSVSSAAAVLYVTQPALTTRIKKLERELEIELFVRTPRGMRLTAEGRAFRPHAQRALQSLASGRELLRELREGRVGELLVGAAPAISTYVLPLVLRRFQTSFPNVHLIVRTGHSEEVLELVLREQVQIGLVRELPHPAVVSSPLYEDEIVLVVHPGHRFGGERSIAVGELGAERLILFDRTSSYFVLTSTFFREAGVVPRGVMELDNVDATKKMVEHGLGIAFLPYTAVREELASGALREVVIEGYEPVRRPIVALRRRDAVVPEDLVDGLLASVLAGRARALAGGPAQVHHDGRTGERASARAEQERGRLRDLLGLEHPLHRLRSEEHVLDDALRRDARRLRLRFDLRLDDRRPHVAGTDRRRTDPVLGTLEREHLDQPEQAVLGGDVPRLVGRSDQAVHRRDGEEASVARLSQRLPGVAREQERARQQDGEQRIPALLRELVDRGHVLEAGARDDDVDPAELLESGVDRGPISGRGGEVGFERRAGPVRIGTQVDGEHVVAVLYEPGCDRAADAAARAGDESPAHGRTLRQEGWFGGVRTRTGLPSGSACTCAAYVRGSVSRMI